MFSFMLLVISNFVFAQAAPKTKLLLSGGLAVPFSPDAFTDGWKTGLSGNFGVGVELTPTLTLIGSFDYNRFGLDDDYFTEGIPGVNIDGGVASIMYFSGALRIKPVPTPSNVQFYVLAGLGFYRVAMDDVTISGYGEYIPLPGDEENALGVHFGAGLEISNFFVETMYISGFTEDDATGHFPIRAGVMVDLGAY